MKLRQKLILIVVAAASSLVLVVAVSAAIGAKQLRDLDDVQGRLVPKLELGPALDLEFQKLKQSLQDAAAAQESSSLEEAAASRARLFELIARAGPVLRPEQAAALRWTIDEYYQQGREVSQRLIAGETGERVVEDMSRLQAAHQRAQSLMQRTTRLGPNELAQSFSLIADATRRAERWRLSIGVIGAATVLLLSWWVGTALLRGMSAVSSGLARFALGVFSTPIVANAEDELGHLARDANAMASSLSSLDERRKRDDWLRSRTAELWDELRGQLEPEQVARRALVLLARRLEAVAGAAYLARAGELELVATHAWSTAEGEPAPRVKLGDGLVGAAAINETLTSLNDFPAAHLKLESALLATTPAQLVLVPLTHSGGAVGVLELAFLKPLRPEGTELLESIARHLAVAMVAAQTHTEQRALLERTLEQASRLSAQEEELRLNNQELQLQQQELQLANAELDAQRGALGQRNLELEAARESEKQKAEELSRVSAYKSQFLANMSHELRTPLNSMLLLSHLLSENEGGNLTPKQVEHSTTIHAAGQDLLGLINQVLDLAKIESGKQELQLEKTELSQLVSYVRRVFQPLADEKKLELRIEIAPGLRESFVTDRKRLEGVLTNLIGNAIKFTESGSVRLKIERPPASVVLTREGASHAGYLCFTVTDTGVGIPVEAAERVFQPFEQLEGRSNRRYAGTGLGLAIARETVNLLGGELQLESRVGAGSTFRCLLPERSLALPDAERAAALVEDDRDSLSPGDPHLLVIEDDVLVANQLVDIVHARDLKAVVARSGKEGLRLATELAPRGIVLDVKLPDTDGWAVIEELRAEQKTRGIPVHFLSGVQAPERGLSLGAVGYLTKPATHAEMATMVRSLTPRASSASSQVLVVEDDAREGAALLDVLRSQGIDGVLATSAESALAHLEQHGAGCVILDLGLPDMDGLSLLGKLRDSSNIEHPRIVVHTGRALTKKETRQLEAYSEAVILKDERSLQRLLEQMRLFLRSVGEGRARAASKQPTASDASL
ncbi:MAG TPA: response regulator, partial [Polyangiaceae bacterium]|nr:response regulator [Polyangiaceae bacterium]